MLIFKHLVIIAYSEKLWDIISFGEILAVLHKSHYSVCISLNLGQKGHNSVK